MERWFARLMGGFITAGPALWIFWSATSRGDEVGGLSSLVEVFLKVCVASAISVGGGFLLSNDRPARVLLSFGLLGAPLFALDTLTTEPSSALLVLLVEWALLWTLWTTRAVPTHERRVSEAELAWEVVRGALPVLALAWFFSSLTSPWSKVPIFSALGASTLGTQLLLRAARPLLRGTRKWSQCLLAVGWLGALWFAPSALAPTSITAALGFFYALTRFWWHQEHPSSASAWEMITTHPARLMVVSFLLIGLAGGSLLALPVSSANGTGVSLLDAMFTAFSAVCVTGLIVVDTPTTYSTFGHIILLLLMQVGGLGIMAFAVIAFRSLGHRMSLRQEGTLANLLNEDDRMNLYLVARTVLLVTMCCEATGALVLGGAFWAGGEAIGSALWRGLFTSISAFCNAGFALQTESLIPYQHQPVILHTVAALIIFGGLGPMVVLALPNWLRRRPISTFSRLVLRSTVLLLIVPFLFIAATEWSGAFAHMSTLDRLHNAWFQSVTLRTAGFNSIDFQHIHASTLHLMVAFMFIGGSPGSTAGGIKNTTAALLLMTVISGLYGRSEVKLFGRQISHASLYQAIAITTLSAFFIGFAVFALELTQVMPLHVAIFEVTSAVGTVGLSVGGTALLDDIGKIIIILCMFAGRVGPLTLFLLFREPGPSPSWTLPKEDIAVG